MSLAAYASEMEFLSVDPHTCSCLLPFPLEGPMSTGCWQNKSMLYALGTENVNEFVI